MSLKTFANALKPANGIHSGGAFYEQTVVAFGKSFIIKEDCLQLTAKSKFHCSQCTNNNNVEDLFLTGFSNIQLKI